MIAALAEASPPPRSSGDPGPAPNSRGSTVVTLTCPSRTSATRFSPVGVSSSSPPAPWATSACSVPSAASTCAIGSTSSGAYTPTTCRCAPAGFVSGPSTLNTVRTPSSRLTGPAWRMAGWWAWANMNPNPTSSMQSATSAGARSMRTPSASSTSADPLRDDTARLPCLATYAPPAAATSAADVEMLNVWAPSPPVPAVSTSVWCCGRAGVTCARMARAQPVISPTVSPFIRSPTRNPAIWAGVAPPSITCIMAACASSGSRSRRSTSVAMATSIMRPPPSAGSSRSASGPAASAPTRGGTGRRAQPARDAARPSPRRPACAP